MDGNANNLKEHVNSLQGLATKLTEKEVQRGKLFGVDHVAQQHTSGIQHKGWNFNQNVEKGENSDLMDNDAFLQEMLQYGDFLKQKMNEGTIARDSFSNQMAGSSEIQLQEVFQQNKPLQDKVDSTHGLKETRGSRNMEDFYFCDKKHVASPNIQTNTDHGQYEEEVDVFVRPTSTGKRVLRSQSCNNSQQVVELNEIMEAANNNHEELKRKRVRGKTINLRLRKLRKQGEKMKIDFNLDGNPINRMQAQLLASRIGAIVRNSIHAPLCYSRWNRVPIEKKEKMLNLLEDDFVLFHNGLLPEEKELRMRSLYKSMGKTWREFKTELFSLYMSYANDEEAIRNRPQDVTKTDWEFLIKKYWKSDYFKATSARNKINRSMQSMPHCTGRTRFSVIEYEDTQENNGVVLSRLRMFGLTRTRKNKKLVDDVAEVKMAQITELKSQREGVIDIDDEEICLRVLGPERPGHIRMRGSSVAGTYSKNLSHAIELEKYKQEGNEARIRAEQAEKVAILANEKAEKAHAYTKKIYDLLQSRSNGDDMDLDYLDDEDLQRNENI